MEVASGGYWVGKVQQILTERQYGETKQITKWSVSTFKGKRKFFGFKIVKYKTRAFNRKIEIKPIPILLIFRLPRKITSGIVVLFSRRIFRILCTIPPAML